MAAIRPPDARTGALIVRAGERKLAGFLQALFLESFEYPLFPSQR
jgi:hypothetical protein